MSSVWQTLSCKSVYCSLVNSMLKKNRKKFNSFDFHYKSWSETGLVKLRQAKWLRFESCIATMHLNCINQLKKLIWKGINKLETTSLAIISIKYNYHRGTVNYTCWNKEVSCGNWGTLASVLKSVNLTAHVEIYNPSVVCSIVIKNDFDILKYTAPHCNLLRGFLFI